MPIHGVISLSDYLAGQRVHYRPKPWFAAVAALFIGGTLWCAVALHDGLIALFPIYLATIFLIYVPLRGRRSFRQNKALSEPMTVELRDEGLYLTNTHANALLPWAHVHKVKSNARIALIYRTSNMFHLIPSRFFSNAIDYETFLQTVRSKTNAAT
jgi:hypothetical protein